MVYDQRTPHARTDTTRHLDGKQDEGVIAYLEGARRRASRFAETSGQLREIHAEIDGMGRAAHGRPTGMLSGGDIDIAYHYLVVGLGIVALVYSFLGAIFVAHGGSVLVLSEVLQRWATGPATAVTDVLLNVRTLGAFLLQAVLFVVIVATRRNRQTWQHWGALLSSVAVTYAGWNSVLLAYGTPPVASFTAVIPAAIVGGALAWAGIKSTNDIELPRLWVIGIIVAGVIAGALGSTALIHWAGVVLAWIAIQVAQRIIIIG